MVPATTVRLVFVVVHDESEYLAANTGWYMWVEVSIRIKIGDNKVVGKKITHLI